MIDSEMLKDDRSTVPWFCCPLVLGGNMTFSIDINGLPVEATYSEESINYIFIPLLHKLTLLQEVRGKRILIFLAAPPGAGKSTLAQFLKRLSENTEGVTPITVIGMDGFHRFQEYLLGHETIRNGKKIPMTKIKGAPETFDLELLRKRIEMVATGDECGWPEYDRTKHDPQENAITVKGNIVLLEGNYLLLNDEGWCELKEYADYTISIKADPELLRKRLIERKEMEMNEYSHEEAVEFVDFSDMVNVHTVLERSSQADLELDLF